MFFLQTLRKLELQLGEGEFLYSALVKATEAFCDAQQGSAPSYQIKSIAKEWEEYKEQLQVCNRYFVLFAVLSTV